MSLRVCWFGIYEPTYPRNDILMRGLRATGVELVEVHADWRDKERHQLLRAGLKERQGTYDVVYAAYPSTMPVLWAKLASRKPVVMDALYSMYDAVVNDRREVPWFHPRAIQLWLLDWLSALLADYLIVDTKQHQAYWSRFPFVRASKMKVLYTGVQDHIFYPAEEPARKDGTFLVSFHGLYIPLQGVEKIAEAAALLQDDPTIRFRLIGAGTLSKKVDAVIRARNLTNIEQTGKLPATEVAERSREADAILGIFGDTEKARRVVPNKVYEGLALRKPVITMDSPSVREIFTEEDMLLIDNTPEAIAAAVRTLKEDPALAERLADHGYQHVMRCYSPAVLGAELKSFLTSISGKAR